MDGPSGRNDSPSGGLARRVRLFITLGVLTMHFVWGGSRATAVDYTVTDSATFFSAIQSVNNAPSGGGDRILLSNSFTMTQQVLAIETTSTLTVVGGGFTINGGNLYRPFFIESGSVTLQDLSITNARAHGGNGGGGGMGAGAAVFVDATGNLTLSNVNFTNNAAIGGNGSTQAYQGGGGLGGNAGTFVNSGGGGLYGTGGNPGFVSGGGGGGQLGNGGNGGDGGGGGGGGEGGGKTANGANGVGTGGTGGSVEGGDGGNNGVSGSAGGSSGGGGGAGSGGSGGTGGLFGGGGGGAGGSGGAGGRFGGGGGGSNGPGGSGGFGGGGGSGSNGLSNGGNGGFGAGGGGGTTGGTSLFGGGNGASGANSGGGGAGFGGAVFVAQGGTITVNGVTNFSGNTVTSGTGANNGLAAGSGLFLQGNGGTITFAPGGNLTQTIADNIVDQTGLTGTAGNSWSLSKSGAGTLVLSGTNQYSGGTTVDAGRLAVNGSVTGPVLVNNGGTLGGNGTISGDLTVGGTLGPGNSIGTLTTTGNFTQAPGSSYQVELNAAGQSDKLVVTGTAAISSGATVSVTPEAGTYTVGTHYTILTSTGGVSGTYNSTVGSPGNFLFSLHYTPNDIELWLDAYAASFASLAQTGNQANTAAYLDALGGSLPSGLDQIYFLAPNAAANALQQLGTEVNGSLAQLGVQNSIFQFNLLSQRAGSGLPLGPDGTALTADDDWFDDSARTAQVFQVSFNQPSGSPAGSSLFRAAPRRPIWGGWVSGYGLGGTAQSDGNSSGGSYGLGGTIFALERRLDEYRVLGLLGSYSNLNLRLNQVGQSSTVNSGQFGTYLLTQDGTSYNLLAGTFGFDGYRSRRQISFGGVSATADGDYNGWQSNVYFEKGWKLTTGRWLLQPYGGLQYNYLRQNGYTETGADPYNLAVSGSDSHALRSLLGLRTSRPWVTRGGQAITPQLRALWLHEYLNPATTLNAGFASAGGSFNTQGLNTGRDWAVLGAGLQWQANRHLGLFANYDVQTNANQTFQVGSGGLQWVW